MKYIKSYKIFEAVDIVSVSDTLQDLFDDYGILYSDKQADHLHWRYGSYNSSTSNRIVIKNIPRDIFNFIGKDILGLSKTINGRAGYKMIMSVSPPTFNITPVDYTSYNKDGVIILKFTEDSKINEEVNPRDIQFIQIMDNYFTTSFEFEIETSDKTNINLDFGILEDEDVVNDITSIIKHEMNILEMEENGLIDKIIQSVIDRSNEGIIPSEVLLDLLDSGKCDTIREMEIYDFTKEILLSHISGEDTQYMTEKAIEYLPNFTEKWIERIDFVEDSTLERGIEIKPKTYLSGISEGIEMINDFYSDLEKQDYWSFSSRTGLHINIGVANKEAKWNPIKGLLMLNDFNEGDKPPLVFKDMTWRLNNKFCGSIMKSINNMDVSEKKNLKDALDLNDLSSTERILSTFLTNKIKEWGYKNFGFNLTKLENNYLEFRYVGGDVSGEILIEKLKYFAFVVYCMTNPEYKRREYTKKLYKFVDNL